MPSESGKWGLVFTPNSTCQWEVGFHPHIQLVNVGLVFTPGFKYFEERVGFNPWIFNQALNSVGFSPRIFSQVLTIGLNFTIRSLFIRLIIAWMFNQARKESQNHTIQSRRIKTRRFEDVEIKEFFSFIIRIEDYKQKD